MKCPFKPVKINKTMYGHECHSAHSVIARVETDFGDCDRGQCMAYVPNTEKCLMMEKCIKNE